MSCVKVMLVTLIMLVCNPTLVFAFGAEINIIASYYGNELRGHRTASGEIFNPEGLTAASRTLPMGSCLDVTYRGKHVRVRINDRGPYVRGRKLDISKGAASRIGFSGVGRVQIKEC